MAERDLLLGALIREILGPRGEADELLSDQDDPLDEFITGVLAPRSLRPRDEDSAVDPDIPGEDDAQADQLGGDAGPDVTPVDDLGPSLDPRLRASSMGISFAVGSGAEPGFDLVATWARYLPEASGGWRRTPRGQVWRSLPCRDAELNVTVDNGVRVTVRARPDRRRPTVMRVSIYLVNDTDPQDDRSARVHLFQPQLRIRCVEGTQLVPLERAAQARNEEDRRLAVLYRGRSTIARGHLCSATWAELDPERPHRGSSPGAHEAPFHHWIDGAAIWGRSDPEIVSEFSPADARTEYVPIVAVNAPANQWRNEFGPSPVLDPEELAELYDADAMRAALAPLVNGFANWLDSERSCMEQLHDERRDVVREQLAFTAAAVDRIQRGIDLICGDDDVRRAFCFANKAIALQSRWANRRNAAPAANHWYPFQLAFQLLTIRGLASSQDPDRAICDLLWFPTGGGKTEAYLGLTAFALAHRRIRATRAGSSTGGAGTTVISRYTLRLLTIQQFRRAAALIAACELLRVTAPAGRRGWRPEGDPDQTPELWGTVRFSIGLWVGGSVTPGVLRDFQFKDTAGKLQHIVGAFSLLRGRTGDGEPAQVTRCPSCGATLAIVGDDIAPGTAETVHLVFGGGGADLPSAPEEVFSHESFVVDAATMSPLPHAGYQVLSLTFHTTANAKAQSVDSWVKDHVRPNLDPDAFLVPARGSRPGYFIRYRLAGTRERDYEFEVYCANPACELAAGIEWTEKLPAGVWEPHEPFQSESGRSDRCPIPVWTVDEQVYQRVPSMVVATVDKFARLSFEPRTAALFGNVTHHHPTAGWFRTFCTPSTGSALPREPIEILGGGTVSAGPLEPPALIIQDELHLIEGPLGSMVGLYETAVDQLATRHGAGHDIRPKYVASTATVREAATQVGSLFKRQLSVFPVAGVSMDDSFFAKSERIHPLDATAPGRLYVGVCAPGRGAQTPLVRCWSRLLQQVSDQRGAVPDTELDGFWTLVGYFNAIRELAGTATLCRQDIPQRLSLNHHPRELEVEELSGRTGSDHLPAMLDALGRSLPDSPVDIVLTTSMFGTGVDVPRLGLMFVAGQPKTTSSYIQATGRVGRTAGGMVVTFLRASRPRDLNHYEYFVGYHDAIYRHVEPITVNPFAERARDHALGPVAVALLRNATAITTGAGSYPVTNLWRLQERTVGGWSSTATLMGSHRSDSEVNAVPRLLEERAQSQPVLRRPSEGEVALHAAAELDRWHQLAKLAPGLLYFEWTYVGPPRNAVVLGDLAHTTAGFDVAYENAPNSLREVESTTTFQGR